jgi:hypothetical protein
MFRGWRVFLNSPTEIFHFNTMTKKIILISFNSCKQVFLLMQFKSEFWKYVEDNEASSKLARNFSPSVSPPEESTEFPDAPRLPVHTHVRRFAPDYRPRDATWTLTLLAVRISCAHVNYVRKFQLLIRVVKGITMQRCIFLYCICCISCESERTNLSRGIIGIALTFVERRQN